MEKRIWEGCELNGKPFGFCFEYSENSNLIGGGFLYEVIKDNFGEEWKDDSNSNCLVYEGGYCKGER